MRFLAISVLGTSGCTPGPSDQTLIDELRVVAAVVDPPEVLPEEAALIDVVVADPLKAGATVAVWRCTPDPQTPCAEDGGLLADRLVVGPLTGDHFVADLAPDPSWTAMASDVPLGVPLWVLACAPGLCPQLDRFARAVEAGVPDPEIDALLATPTAWIADLPLTGVNLGTKQLMVSTRGADLRNHNPVLTVEGALSSAPGAELALTVTVEDQEDVAQVMGLSTGGGFGLPAFDVFGGQAIMRWYAPDEAAEVRLYTVATDGVGGMAVWIGDWIGDVVVE